MGKRGPRPKPTHLKVLAGNPGRRPLPENEPKPPEVAPRCPSWLDAEAKKEWRRCARLLEPLGLLTAIDGTAMAMYCSAYSRWKKADLWIQKHGEILVLKNEDGSLKYVQKAPYVGITEKAMEQIRRLCQEFGMTPSARGQMNLPKRDQPDEYEEFRRRGKGTDSG